MAIDAAPAARTAALPSAWAAVLRATWRATVTGGRRRPGAARQPAAARLARRGRPTGGRARCSRKRASTHSVLSPYRTDARKDTLEAPRKYRVGIGSSTTWLPLATIWAKISWSKTKSSELRRKATRRRKSAENAR